MLIVYRCKMNKKSTFFSFINQYNINICAIIYNIHELFIYFRFFFFIPNSSSFKVKKDAQNFRNVMSTTASYSNKPTVANSASAASLTIECRTNQPVKVPPPRPPRSKKVPSSSSKRSCRPESDNVKGVGG